MSGERRYSPADALVHGVAAAAELGLVADFCAALDGDLGSWLCLLRRDGELLHSGSGSGKGDRDTARAGAMFEALERHVGGLPGLPTGAVKLRSAHELAARGTADIAIELLAEGPDEPLGCLVYQELGGDGTADVPVFLSMPDYLGPGATIVRRRFGDGYDYTALSCFSAEEGWACGADPLEATVHAINELVERDALSLLRLRQHYQPVAVVDPATLPAGLATMLAQAQAVVGTPVTLVDMTTDLGIPSYLCHAARHATSGSGASLCRRQAIIHAVTDLVQGHTGNGSRMEFTPRLDSPRLVAFADTPALASPEAHRDELVRLLKAGGFTVYRRDHYVTKNIAVVHVFIPGLERSPVPGRRGRAAAERFLSVPAARVGE